MSKFYQGETQGIQLGVTASTRWIFPMGREFFPDGQFLFVGFFRSREAHRLAAEREDRLKMTSMIQAGPGQSGECAWDREVMLRTAALVITPPYRGFGCGHALEGVGIHLVADDILESRYRFCFGQFFISYWRNPFQLGFDYGNFFGERLVFRLLLGGQSLLPGLVLESLVFFPPFDFRIQLAA